MGKLAIISDLHADINRFGEKELQLLADVLAAGQATRVHFAGDTANKITNARNIYQFFRARGFATTFNLGNHEMGSISGEALIEHYPDSHFLNLRYLPLNDQTVLLGLNGWYDYQFSETKDVKKIQSLKKMYWYDRIIQRDGDDLTVDQRILQQLEPILTELKRKEYQVILATHFVPQPAFIVRLQGNYQIWNQLNAFLGSASLGKLLDRYDNIQQVVFGHTHRRFDDQIIQGTRYSCRPLGYFYEWGITRDFILGNGLAAAFNPMKARKIIHQHREAFDSYTQAHIVEEFQQAITWIAYE